MKLLIELDDDYYHKIMTIKPSHYTARVYISIQNGTPLNECKAEIPLSVYKQVCTERDVAIEQLHELGYEFGQKIEPTTKNNLGVENDLVGSIIEKISEKVTETREEFIFETIRPYCENVVQMKISKRDLEQALLKYYGKNDLGVDWKSYKDTDGNSLDDLILEVLQNNFDCGNTYGYKVADEIIELLPSLTPQEPRWIPVSERLPEPYMFVNATCRSLVDDREDWVVETIYLPIPKEANKLGYSDWGNIPILNWGEAEVIAWVERIIPEPYKMDGGKTDGGN